MASSYRSAITKFAKRHGPAGDTKYDIHPKPVPGKPDYHYYQQHRKKRPPQRRLPPPVGLIDKLHPKRIV